MMTANIKCAVHGEREREYVCVRFNIDEIFGIHFDDSTLKIQLKHIHNTHHRRLSSLFLWLFKLVHVYHSVDRTTFSVNLNWMCICVRVSFSFAKCVRMRPQVMFMWTVKCRREKITVHICELKFERKHTIERSRSSTDNHIRAKTFNSNFANSSFFCLFDTLVVCLNAFACLTIVVNRRIAISHNGCLREVGSLFSTYHERCTNVCVCDVCRCRFRRWRRVLLYLCNAYSVNLLNLLALRKCRFCLWFEMRKNCH